MDLIYELGFFSGSKKLTSRDLASGALKKLNVRVDLDGGKTINTLENKWLTLQSENCWRRVSISGIKPNAGTQR